MSVLSPRACDVEERLSIDRPEVDPAHVSFNHNLGRRRRLDGNPERAREVVCRSERHDAEWQTGFDQGWRRRVERAVSPAQHNKVYLPSRATDARRELVGIPAALALQLNPAFGELPGDLISAFAALPATFVYDIEGAARRHLLGRGLITRTLTCRRAGD